jgi:phospholipase D1/2
VIEAASQQEHNTGRSSPAERIIAPGRNCWRVERASRFYCIQDAAEYFRLVRWALLEARHSVFSLGWDITAHTDLLPGVAVPPEAPDAPTRLDKLLVYVARRRPNLRCYILTWDYGALYTLERDPFTRWRLGWRMPRGVRFGFDDRHPVGACHHQKVIVVDDRLAFCGGVDLTGHRWDTSAHRPDEPARTTPLGEAYGPYHEVQAMVTGPAATSLGVLSRDRWRALGDDRMPPLDSAAEDLWPSDITPDLADVDVAIVRTMPATESQPAIRECEALFLDSIARAKKTIYIENQYFTNDKLAGALAARLKEQDGPEVIVISPKECHGWLEKTTMGAFRDGAFRQLLAADEHGRLRLVYPTASRSRDVPTFVHSKVMIVDEALARIGSANCSHRSMGVDTECDLAVDAGGNPDVGAGIRRVRDRLLGEHLGMSGDDAALGIERAGSIAAFIDTRQDAEHTLLRIDMSKESAPPSPALQAAADPDEPVALGSSVESLVPAVDAANARSPLRLWILPGVVLAAAAAVASQSSHTLDSIPVAPSSLWIGIGVFVLAGSMLIPLELLAIAAGVCFGTLRGGLVALIGSLAAAIVGYVAGRAIGGLGLPRWMSRRSYRSIRQLSARGVVGVIMLRLASVASAGSIHLVCGAARVPFASYMAGTAIGLAPAIVALAGLGGLLRHTFLNPSLSNGLATIGVAVLLFAVASGLRAFLLLRQFAPAISSHRGQAEFG